MTICAKEPKDNACRTAPPVLSPPGSYYTVGYTSMSDADSLTKNINQNNLLGGI